MATQEKSPKTQPKIEVVMVPFPAQSHLNQLLQLSHIISSYNIKVHYAGSALHVSQVKSRAINQYQKPNQNIQFHEFPTPDFPSPPPSNTQFPSHLLPCFESSVELRHPLKNLLVSLSETSTRLVVIHDPLMSYVVQDATALVNVETYVFNCISALFRCIYLRDYFGLKMKEEIPSFEGILYPEFNDFIISQSEFLFKNISGMLYNTCRVIEGEFIDLSLEKERENDENMRLWAIGPLHAVQLFKDKPANTLEYCYCLEWLDKQEPNSVLYISFGTTCFIKDDQIKELAIGLEESGTKFIWVLRDADKGNILDGSEVRRPQLPQEFEQRMEGNGMGIVVREWAPQLEILGHSSTGGFMSHCGWNSCVESISLGVPIVTWPMHSDQPVNAFFVTQMLKAGLVVREWANRDELVSSSVISEVVKRLMNSEEGHAIRKRAKELGSELRKSTEEGGVSRSEMDSFIAHITRA